MDIKKTKQIKIIISVIVLIAAVAVAYLLDFTKWKEIGSVDNQIKQVESQISAKRSYYAIIDSKIEALNSAGWATKKDSLAINFDSSLFFTPKINSFFQAIVASSGMKLDQMTSSSQELAKPKSQTTTTTESGAKSSEITETPQTTTPQGDSYLAQLKGPVKKTTVNLNVTGTYSQFKYLLSLFEGQTRIVTVKSVGVSSTGEGGAGGKVLANSHNFDVVLDVYSY